MANDVKIEFAAITDAGRVRLQNEDCVAISPSHGFAVLADGMGGYSAGEIASSMAVEAVKSILERELLPWDADEKRRCTVPHRFLDQALDDAIQTANTAILEASHAEPGQMGMGTTIVAAVFGQSTITIAHVGDSRAYRLRQSELVQLTRDHSLLQEQIDAGLIHPEWARYAQNKNLVTRAVGVGTDMEVEVNNHHTQTKDLYLLCSDGLSDMLTKTEIHALLACHTWTLQEICEALVERANENGGYDNISAVLLRVQASQKGEEPSLFDRIRNWIS